MNCEDGNIVEINQWKADKKETQFSEYLKVLNFNDLILESNSLITEIKGHGPRQDLLSKTKSMMNEFAFRLEKESKHLAESVRDLKKQIDTKKD
jgi:hypothetical protein